MEKQQLTVSEFFEKFPFFKQNKLAEMLGLSATMISAYARDERQPTAYFVKRMNTELKKVVKELQNIEII